MNEVLEQVQSVMRERLVAHGAGDAVADPRLFDEVYTLFRQALAHNTQHQLLLPELLADPWQPELSLRLSSHRQGPVASAILFAKRRVMLPLTRWLYEYSLENFRRQDRLNVLLMACLQSFAAEHARLKLRVAALEALQRQQGGAPAPGAGSGSP